MSFGVLVIGPSGSGKSTLTCQMQEIYNKMDIATTVISLDPANETVKYQPDLDIRQLITVEDVMEEYGIGPNASMMYCMEFLEKNLDWLVDRITPRLPSFLIFDLPGQIELYINHDSLKNIIKALSKLNIQLCTVQLFDCSFVYELNHFLSLCMMSLATLVNFETPHINVLSKIDIMKERRPDGDFLEILNCSSLTEMVEMLALEGKNEGFLQAVGKIIDSYGMVSFIPMDISRIELVAQLLFEIEQSLGSLYGKNNKKFAVLVEKFYKDPGAYKDIMLHDLENELFPEETHDKNYYQQELEKLGKD